MNFRDEEAKSVLKEIIQEGDCEGIGEEVIQELVSWCNSKGHRAMKGRDLSSAWESSQGYFALAEKVMNIKEQKFKTKD